MIILYMEHRTYGNIELQSDPAPIDRAFAGMAGLRNIPVDMMDAGPKKRRAVTQRAVTERANGSLLNPATIIGIRMVH